MIMFLNPRVRFPNSCPFPRELFQDPRSPKFSRELKRYGEDGGDVEDVLLGRYLLRVPNMVAVSDILAKLR